LKVHLYTSSSTATKSLRIVTTRVTSTHKDAGNPLNFSAIQLLHDPQTFGERLYDLLQIYDARFSLDHKIIIMQLLSRVTTSSHQTRCWRHTHTITDSEPFRPMPAYEARASHRSLHARH
ncbi:hypothetical protein BGW80DRAFT_1346414, partial [Lactifluus volemus]